MGGDQTLLLAYAAPLTLIWGWYVVRRQRRERTSLAVREQALAAGLAEPASLHPVIDRPAASAAEPA